MVYCFNGEPKFIMAKKIFENYTINNYYDLDWRLTELETDDKYHIRDPNYIIKKPKNLFEMLKYSKMLSQEFVFVRVDLYEVNGLIFLGELTFTPVNGFKKWKNINHNKKIAKLIDINKIKDYLYNN